MYSQDNEEEIIKDHFGSKIGAFLDVGAADGMRFSNTRWLFEHGWSGVFVEPSPRQFLKLWELYKDEPKASLVNAALGEIEQLSVFHYCPDTMVNTLNEDVYQEWSRGGFKYSSWQICILSVYRFLLSFSQEYDFISIDAEGESWKIALAFLHNEKFASLYCIEHDKDQAFGEKEMARYGYEKILENGNNTMWRRLQS